MKHADRLRAGLEEALAYQRGEIPLTVTTGPSRLATETDEEFAKRWASEATQSVRFIDGRPAELPSG